MSLKNNANDVLHKIRIKLYPNYLTHVKGKYIARADSEAVLTIEQVCAALKNRGGYSGNYEELVENVRRFFDEAAYQLCDGFAVNTGYYSIHPNIRGTFNSAREIHDKKKNPVGFSFRTGKKLRKLAGLISVEIEGEADTNGIIEKFFDISRLNINETVTANGMFVITGSKIKIAGGNPECGIYFEPADEPQNRIKVTYPLAVNSPSKITGITPALTAEKIYRPVIVTQYSGSGVKYLKEPREITGNFELLSTVN